MCIERGGVGVGSGVGGEERGSREVFLLLTMLGLED